MRAGIAITRLELTASGLRAAARRAKNVSAARRMLCLAMVQARISHRIKDGAH